MNLKNLSATLLIVLLAQAPLLPAQDAHAQDDDWSVSGGDARQREIMRRYRVLLERNPTEGLAFKKLVEMAGGAKGLDRLIAEYRKKAEAKPDELNFQLILGHLLRQRGQFEEAITAYTQALAIDKESSIGYLGRGQAYTQLQKNAEATTDYEQALAFSTDRSAKQEILRQLADLAFAQRDWEAAQGYYDRLVELDPRNEFLRMEYAQVLVKYRRYDKALEQYEALIKLAGRDVKTRATTMRDMGDLYEKMGKDEEALALYRDAQKLVRSSNWLYRELEQRIISLYRQTDRLEEYAASKKAQWRSPNYDQAMILAALFDELGNEDESFNYYTIASRKSSRALDPRVKLIQILQRRGDHKGVVKAYEGLIRIAPSQDRFQFDLARVHFRNGDRGAAEKILKNIRSRFRRDPDVLVRLADTYMRLAMNKEALDVYRQLVRAEPRNESYITSLGEYYYQSGETQKAIETWEMLLKSNLSKAEALAQLGLVFVEHNMVERGIREYEKAVQAAPKDPEIQRGLALAYENGRYWDKAIETWSALMEPPTNESLAAEARGRIIVIYKRDNRLRSKIREFSDAFNATPPDIEAGFFLAESYSKVGEDEKALLTWRRIVDADGVVDEKDIPALMQLEKIYTQRSQTSEAIKVLQTLAELRPARSREYYNRIAELSLSNYEEDQAVRYAKMALEKNPDDASAHARLGRVYARMQRLDEAIASYRVAVDLDPRAFEVYFPLAELLLEKGEDEEAKSIYRLLAKKAVDESMILMASRRSIALTRSPEELELLEGELAPLVFKSPPKPVYRKIVLEIYGRLSAPLIARRNFGSPLDELERDALTRLGARAFPILMDALQAEDIGQRQLAVRMLGELRLGSAALVLGRMVSDEKDPLRMQAVIAVARIGDERAATPLLRALDDGQPGVRDAATWALGSVGGKEAVSELILILREEQSARQQAIAAVSLGRIGSERALKPLLTALEASKTHRYNDSLSLALAFALGALKHPAAVDALDDVMRQSAGRAGPVAAWGLAHIGSEAARTRLLNAYWSGEATLRDRARHGLLWSGAAASAQARVKADYATMHSEARFVSERDMTFEGDAFLENLSGEIAFVPIIDAGAMVARDASLISQTAREKLSQSDALVQAEVLDDLARPALGLGQPGDAAKLRAVRQSMLKALQPQLREFAAKPDASVVRPALILLGMIGDAQDLNLLIKATTSQEPELRRAALTALGEGFASSPAAQSALMEGLKDRDFGARAASAHALATLTPGSQSQGVEAALMGALKDSYLSVRVEATHALGALRAERAVPQLVALLDEPSLAVKLAALTALSHINSAQANKALTPWKTHADWRLRGAARGE